MPGVAASLVASGATTLGGSTAGISALTESGDIVTVGKSLPSLNGSTARGGTARGAGSTSAAGFTGAKFGTVACDLAKSTGDGGRAV